MVKLTNQCGRCHKPKQHNVFELCESCRLKDAELAFAASERQVKFYRDFLEVYYKHNLPIEPSVIKHLFDAVTYLDKTGGK